MTWSRSPSLLVTALQTQRFPYLTVSSLINPIPVYHAAYRTSRLQGNSSWSSILIQYNILSNIFFCQRLRPAKTDLEGYVGAGEQGRSWAGIETPLRKVTE